MVGFPMQSLFCVAQFLDFLCKLCSSCRMVAKFKNTVNSSLWPDEGERKTSEEMKN